MRFVRSHSVAVTGSLRIRSRARGGCHVYGIVETAKANGLEPYAYLRWLFERLHDAKTVEDFEALLPFSMTNISGNNGLSEARVLL